MNVLQVSCQLPQGRTAFGEPVEVKVDDCPDPHCFVHKMPYNPDEMDQIKNLIQRSSVCTQRITIKCKSAPLQVNKYFNCFFFKKGKYDNGGIEFGK